MDGKPLAPDQPLWLSDYGSMKTAELNPKVTVTAKVIGVTPTQATIDVSANGVALYVMVRTQIVPGHFSRNSYDVSANGVALYVMVRSDCRSCFLSVGYEAPSHQNLPLCQSFKRSATRKSKPRACDQL